jgi:hypothetical protein
MDIRKYIHYLLYYSAKPVEGSRTQLAKIVYPVDGYPGGLSVIQ